MTGVGLNGKRGRFLLAFGLLTALLGFSYVFVEPGSTVLRTMAWLPSVWGVQRCGLVFIAAGIVAIVSGFLPFARDRYGFAAICGVFLGWSGAHLIAWVLGYATRGWVAAGLFFLVSYGAYAVAGMIDPMRLPRRVVR